MAIIQIQVAGETYDSYASLAEVNRWNSVLFRTEPGITYPRDHWTKLSDDDKLARMARVSRQMDTLRWNESADTQAKRGEIPAIANAMSQLVGEDWRFSDNSARMPQSISSGGITITPSNDPRTQFLDVELTAQAHGLSDVAYRLLSPYLAPVRDSARATPMSFDQ